MRLNPVNGKAALGFSTNLSVDGVVPAPLVGIGAQLPRWLDAAGNVLIFSNFSTPSIQTIDLDTDVVTTVMSGEASRLGAGNNVWVRSSNFFGVNGSSIADWGPFPEAGLADVDEDGRFALIQYFAGDRGMVLFDAAGVRQFAYDEPLHPSAVPRTKTNLLSFCRRDASWSVVSLVDGSPIAFAPRAEVNELIPLELASGTVMVVERTNMDTLTIRQATTGVGYTLSSSIVYNPDAIELSPGVVRIGWSSSPGEAPTNLRMVDLNLNTGATTDWTTEGGSLVSDTGPTLSSVSYVVGPVVGGSGALNPLPLPVPHPLVDKQGQVTKPWQLYFNNGSVRAAAPIDLSSRVTGTLPPGNGGTGGNTGTSVINAGNVTEGTLPQSVKSSQYDITTTGTANNVYFNSADLLRADNASALTITGLLAGVGGQQLVIVAADDDVTLAHDSGSSAAENRLVTFTGADVTLLTNEAALLEYDETEARWRVVMISAASSASDPAFGVISVAGQSDVDATIPTDEVEFVAGPNMVITTDAGASPKQVIFEATGGGGGSWIPLVDGSEPPVFITDGAGVLILVAGP